MRINHTIISTVHQVTLARGVLLREEYSWGMLGNEGNTLGQGRLDRREEDIVGITRWES